MQIVSIQVIGLADSLTIVKGENCVSIVDSSGETLAEVDSIESALLYLQEEYLTGNLNNFDCKLAIKRKDIPGVF